MIASFLRAHCENLVRRLTALVARSGGARVRHPAGPAPGAPAREAAQQRYGNLVQLLPDAVLVHGEEGIVFANPAAVALLGVHSEEDLLGRSPLEFVHPADRPVVRRRIRELLEGVVDANHRIEVRMVGLDGREHAVDANAAAFPDAGGRSVEVVLRDVTERKRAAEALRASEERLREHIDNSPLAVIEFDPSFRVTRWSQEAERLFGWTAGEMIGRRIPDVRWVHDDDVESVKQESARLLGGSLKRTLNVNRNYRKDGSVVHCEWYSSALHDADGRLISILSQVLDVTDRQRAQAELQEADRRKTEFFAVLSHELRNHLAPIDHGLRLLGLTPPGSPQFERAREIVRRQVDHVTSLVSDLLDVSRVNVGKLRIEPARLDARDTLRRACDDLRPSFEERGVPLHVALPAEPLWVDADAGRLTQIVANLLSNALKFTPPPGAVHVSAAPEAGMMTLRVRDEGIGVEPRFLASMFDQFAQAGAPGSPRSGMGIGLALVKTLAALHGGTVRARSEGPGKGTECVVSLPLATAPARAERPPVPARPLRTRSLDILVVEDNRDAAETLEALLQLQGHRTRVAYDARAATEAFRARAPDVVLSDVGLPDLDGHELMRRLRALEGGGRIFAIAVTGYAQVDDERRARDAGFDAHLAKPASLERLEELLAVGAARTAPGDASSVEAQPSAAT